jgi:hypothetical protein
MSDPIEKLNRLGDALEGAPMPLPASEIRARGDRIRRRKHAVIAGASAAVVAAVAVPVIAITAGDSSKEIPPADPSVSDPLPVPPSALLSERNLLTDDQAIYPNGGSDWRPTETFPGDGQGTASPCQQSSVVGLGAGSVFQRHFEFVVRDTGDVEPTLTFNEVVAEFPSDREAQAAYEEIRGWYDDCTPAGSEYYNPGEFSDVPIGEVGLVGAAEVQLSTYGPVDDALDPSGVEGWFLETGLVRIDDRIAVLTQLTHGQDYNWPEGTPVFQMVPEAATQLVLGNESEQTPSEPATDWPTSIPAGFPLTSGWPEDDGSSEYQLDPPSADNQAMIPAGDLHACVFDAVDPRAVARLTARLSYGSDSYVRELQLLPTDQEAVTYLAQLWALYEGCPTDDQNGAPPTFTTEVNNGAIGEESVVITRASDGIGRVVINAVRVGNAVVVDLASDEGEGDTVIDLATETRENLADVVAGLYDLAPSVPTDPGSDLTDPAGTTAIPADFPLDLALGEPPAEDSETTISGPEADVDGVRPQTACRDTLSMPGSSDPEDQLGYSISSIGGYDGRTIETHATVQDAIDRMDQLRAELQGCDRDNEGDGLSDRLWESFNSDTGYDSMTFGWTYEATEFQGPTAGQLYSVVRVANAILAIEWGSEGSAQSQVDSAPNQVELAQLIAAEMCVFAEAGC